MLPPVLEPTAFRGAYGQEGMSMEWIKATNVPHFGGAEAVLVSGDWLLAKWNHSKCRGWQVYRRAGSRTRWLAGAGIESLDWSDEQAQGWAELQIATMGG